MGKSKSRTQKKDKRPNGEGSVYRRASDGRWVGAAVVGYRPDGKPKRRYVYGDSLEEVLPKLRKIQTDVDRGTYVDPAKQTLGEWLDHWLNNVARHSVREATWHHYVEIVGRYLPANLANLRLQRITAQHIQALYGDMLARGLSARTVRYLHAILSPALRHAEETGLIPKSPARHVKLPRQQRREMDALTPDEAARFLESVREDRLHALWEVALRTGMRPSEYLALRWDDVDLKSGKIVVRRTLRRVSGQWMPGEPKTARGLRTLTITEPVIWALERWRVRQKQERLMAGPDWQDTGLVFTGLNGQPIDRSWLLHRWQKLAQQAGVRPIRLYDLRHTAATLLIASGVPIPVAAQMLGHDPAVLLRTYAHVLPGQQEEAARKLDSLIERKR